MDWLGEVTNANEYFSAEEAPFEVLYIRRFPLPEKRGEVVCFENDFVVLDVTADTVVTMSVP